MTEVHLPGHLRERLGGTHGNAILTSATGALLTVLLLAEGATIPFIGGLLSAHMVIGMILIPPVALKFSSTGYRFARYYAGSRPYRQKGPPALGMRVLAPILVVTTALMLGTGVWLMLLGHKSDQVLFFHKVSFFVWSALFAIHLLFYLPRMARSLRGDWTAASRQEIPGSSLRAMLVAASVGGGAGLALLVLPLITGWDGTTGA